MNDDISRVAALAEPVRRQLYRVVSQARGWVSREQAAQETGLPAHVAKFHLDRLAKAGLLEIEYRRLSGRSGPGAGRPSKLYRRTATEVAVTIPPRQYDLLSRILANAVVEARDSGTPTDAVALDVARREGTAEGERTDPSEERTPAGLCRRLADVGFEPETTPTGIDLSNCPFHAVAQQQTELVCGINLAYVQGLIEAMPCPSAHARLSPHPEKCCVTVDISESTAG